MEHEVHLSGPELFQAVERLSPAELERLALEVAALRARRNAPVLSTDESPLFGTINRMLPDADRSHLAELGHRRQEKLSPDEHAELLRLQQRLEALHTARMKALEELARRRGLTLTDVMEQLGIEFPDQE
jgi:hypothetical protein